MMIIYGTRPTILARKKLEVFKERKERTRREREPVKKGHPMAIEYVSPEPASRQ